MHSAQTDLPHDKCKTYIYDGNYWQILVLYIQLCMNRYHLSCPISTYIEDFLLNVEAMLEL